jgi:hypothetical protein
VPIAIRSTTGATRNAIARVEVPASGAYGVGGGAVGCDVGRSAGCSAGGWRRWCERRHDDQRGGCRRRTLTGRDGRRPLAVVTRHKVVCWNPSDVAIWIANPAPGPPGRVLLGAEAVICVPSGQVLPISTARGSSRNAIPRPSVLPIVKLDVTIERWTAVGVSGTAPNVEGVGAATRVCLVGTGSGAGVDTLVGSIPIVGGGGGSARVAGPEPQAAVRVAIVTAASSVAASLQLLVGCMASSYPRRCTRCLRVITVWESQTTRTVRRS